MRVLIVDDEPAARRRLALMLEGLAVELVGEAGNGLEALDRARELRPDLLLLDIAMPEVDGFDVARRLADPRPLIVFQTAHDEHALEAFEHEALDYLVKPVSQRRLERALERARRRLAGERPAPLAAESVTRLRQALGLGAPAPRLLVRHGRGHRLLAYRDILRFSAEAGLVYAHDAEGRHLTDDTLGELEVRTAGSFVRVSRSDLVAIEAVERITSDADGGATLVLSDGRSVRVSRRRTSDVRQALGA